MNSLSVVEQLVLWPLEDLQILNRIVSSVIDIKLVAAGTVPKPVSEPPLGLPASLKPAHQLDDKNLLSSDEFVPHDETPPSLEELGAQTLASEPVEEPTSEPAKEKPDEQVLEVAQLDPTRLPDAGANLGENWGTFQCRAIRCSAHFVFPNRPGKKPTLCFAHVDPRLRYKRLDAIREHLIKHPFPRFPDGMATSTSPAPTAEP